MQFKLPRRLFVRLAKLAALGSIVKPLQPLAAQMRRDTDQALLHLRVLPVSMREVDLTWDGFISAAISQLVIRRNGQIIASLPSTLSGYTDSEVRPGEVYTYTIEAINSNASMVTASSTPTTITTPEQPEFPDMLPPSLPEDFAAVPYPGYILLDWYGSNDDADVTCYLLNRNGQRLALVHSGVLDYRDTTAQIDIDYSYTLEAIDTSGNHSAKVEVTDVRALPGYTVFLPSVQNGSSPTLPIASPSMETAYNTHLRRYPYLTDLVGSYVTINWSTDTSGSTGSVTYGEVGSETPSAHTVVATRTAITVNSVSQYQWKAVLSLQANKQYQYRVLQGTTDLLGSDPAPTFWTQVPAGSSQPFSFVVLGDWGDIDNAGSAQASLMQLVSQTNARFGFTTGDNGYSSGSQTNYGDLVQTGPATSGIFGPSFWALPGRSLALFPALGNHGFTSSSSAHPHLINWPQDKATELSEGRYQRENYGGIDGITPTSYPSTWYAFDAGKLRFYMLEAAWADSNIGNAESPYQVDYDYHWTPNSVQYQWLANDLAAHPSAIKMVIFHYPMYSDNKSEKADTYLQGANSLEGLLKAHDVKLVFNGHAHFYQRSVVDGITYYLVGNSGTKTQYPDAGCGLNSAYAIGWSNSKSKGYACGAAIAPSSVAQVYHFLKVTVDGSSVTVSPMNSLGQVFDQQSFSFSTTGDTTAPSMPTQLQAVAVSSTQVNLSWMAATDNVAVVGYDIYRDGTLLTSVGPVTTFEDTTVSPTTTYVYRVAARDASGNTSAPSVAGSVTTPSGTDTLVPSVPTNVAATASGATLVNLTWTTSTDNVGVTGYDIYRNGTLLTSVGAVTTYADSSVIAATTYQYRLAARDAAGNTSAQSSVASVTTPSGTSVIFQDGFESGTLSAWTSSVGLVIQTGIVQSGSRAVQANTTVGNTYAKKTFATTYMNCYSRLYFNLLSYTSQVNILRVRTASDGSIAYLYVTTTGKLALRNDVGAVTFTSLTSVGSGWHALELHVGVSDAASATEVWLDGIKIQDLSVTTNLGSTPVGRLQIGEVQSGRTYNLIIDNVVFNTQQIGL